MPPRNLGNIFSTPIRKTSKQGQVGYDNPRENIDPHVRTKVVSTKEAIIGDYTMPTDDGTNGQFLKTDGAGVASWANAAGGGDVTAGANLTDETLVQGDGGAKGVKTSTATVAQIEANTAKDTNVTTNITIVEAPTNVDVQSSDGTNDTIAAADVTNAGVMTTTMYDEHVVNTAHAIDNTQAHTDYLLNNADDTTSGFLTAKGYDTANVISGAYVHATNISGANISGSSIVGVTISGSNITGGIAISGANIQGTTISGGNISVTGDNASADEIYVPNVLYNTDATPPTANTTPIGTLYIQYTA